MLISLYTSRVILNALGVEDYGIYNVVGGIVTIFSLLSGSLSAAISRFITFELGTGNVVQLKKVFSSAVTVQILFALFIFLLGESLGLWFLNYKLVIPDERMIAANWCFQFSLITFVINLISIPYNAAIIAHERMSAFAYISILEASGKLLIAWFIGSSPIDRLIFYSLMIAVIAWTIRMVYASYCKRNFEECGFFFNYDYALLKKMFSFAGWNFIGGASGILRDHGVNLLLNLFYGPAVNASRGIAMQVNDAVSNFVNNFLTAIRPQITKSFASNDYNYTFKLVFTGARMSFFLFLLLSMPIILETPIVLSLWLKLVPDYSVIFIRLILIYIMTESVSYTMVTLMLATGDIKKYQIFVGGFQMLNFPISYLLLYLGFSPEWTIINSIVIAIGCLSIRLCMLHQMINFPSIQFVKTVIFKILLVVFISLILPIFVHLYFAPSIIRFFIVCITCAISVLSTVFFVGCTQNERNLVLSSAKNFYRKKITK